MMPSTIAKKGLKSIGRDFKYVLLCIIAVGCGTFYVVGHLNPFPKEDPIGDLLIVSSSALDISRIQTGVDLGYANSVPVTVSVVAPERGNADQKIFWAPGSRRDEAYEHYAVCLRCQLIGPQIRWPLGCDVLVDVEEVAGIVRPLDLDQAVVVLAVVVLDLAVVVILHEVDVAAGL